MKASSKVIFCEVKETKETKSKHTTSTLKAPLEMARKKGKYQKEYFIKCVKILEIN